MDAAAARGVGARSWGRMEPGELGPDGQPIIPVAELVAQAVQATMEAIPTPTPAPTPNIAATLQADLELNRERWCGRC